jgi:hypothetical protein
MPQYFFKFPKLVKNNILLTDLTTRIKIRDKYLDNDDLYYLYEMQDGDTPEIIASKYYGSAELHWIVLITNNIFDKDFDIPMPYGVFRKYIDDKYKDNFAVGGLTVENPGAGYTANTITGTLYERVTLSITNQNELTKKGKNILVNLMIDTGGSIIGDPEIFRGGVGYDANTLFTINDSRLGTGTTPAVFSINRFMDAIEYTQSTIQESYGYKKEIRIMDTGSVKYEVNTAGYLVITSEPSAVLSRTIFNIGENDYYNLYEGTDPHPAEMITLDTGVRVLYDSIRVPPTTIYDHESILNDNKRYIKILKKEYYYQAVQEFVALMAQTYE